MVLNYIWIAFFLISLAVGFIKLIFFHDTEVFTNMVNSTFEMAGVSVEICLGLIGVLTLWLGLMKVGEKGGAVNILAKVVRPLIWGFAAQTTPRWATFHSQMVRHSAQPISTIPSPIS